MSESENDTPAAARDPKELMREALERKKGAAHHTETGPSTGPRAAGAARGQAGVKREFRRKSGS